MTYHLLLKNGHDIYRDFAMESSIDDKRESWGGSWE